MLSASLSHSFSFPLSEQSADLLCLCCNFRRFQFEEIGYNNRARSACTLAPLSVSVSVCACVLVSAHAHTHTHTHCVGKQNNENETLGQCLGSLFEISWSTRARHYLLSSLSSQWLSTSLVSQSSKSNRRGKRCRRRRRSSRGSSSNFRM